MESEDFSFPVIRGSTCSSPIDSPPLWHLSPASSPISNRKQQEEDDDDSLCFPEKTLNFLKQRNRRRSCSDLDDIDSEEKMDVLWEDFNDESLSSRSTSGKSSSCVSYRDNNMGCVGPLKLSRRGSCGVGGGGGSGGGGVIVPPRGKPGLVVLIKVLKKIFLLQNNHSSQNRYGKKKAWRSN